MRFQELLIGEVRKMNSFLMRISLARQVHYLLYDLSDPVCTWGGREVNWPVR